ncbi:hydroxymethylglutaryl-CoA reductase, degradative [Ligilactobacillus sp. LYQ135]
MRGFEKYYRKTRNERLAILRDSYLLNDDEIATLDEARLNPEIGDTMIENFITDYRIPEGLALNFRVNDKDYLVPMVTEEPSVIAAASNGARLTKKAGGFYATLPSRLMLGQIVIENVKTMDDLVTKIEKCQAHLIEVANQAHPSIVRRGGGARWIRCRILADDLLSVDLAVDVQEAMGANMLNTMLEAVADEIEELYQQDILMSILSNYATESLVTVKTKVPIKALSKKDFSGREVAQKIQQASRLAQLDCYRATTNNKGIMNGIDAVTIASGNDWRAIEAGAHAYAARSGQYKGLSIWKINGDFLEGKLTLPMPVGFVGGSIKIVPLVKINHKLMKVENARELAEVIASVGLGQNLAALYALVTDGIQRGHMKLQLKSLSASVGATGKEIGKLVKMLEKNHVRDSQSAKKLLKKLREEEK